MGEDGCSEETSERAGSSGKLESSQQALQSHMLFLQCDIDFSSIGGNWCWSLWSLPLNRGGGGGGRWAVDIAKVTPSAFWGWVIKGNAVSAWAFWNPATMPPGSPGPNGKALCQCSGRQPTASIRHQAWEWGNSEMTPAPSTDYRHMGAPRWELPTSLSLLSPQNCERIKYSRRFKSPSVSLICDATIGNWSIQRISFISKTTSLLKSFYAWDSTPPPSSLMKNLPVV